MAGFRAMASAVALIGVAAAQQGVSFPTQDGGLIYADIYGKGDRGEGQSRGGIDGRPLDEGRHLDVLAAIHYLRQTGAKSTGVVGASMGGDYAAEAADAEPVEIDRLVMREILRFLSAE